jgi:hypothetical protein
MMKIGHRFFRGSEFLFPEVAFSDIILMITAKCRPGSMNRRGNFNESPD